MRRAAGFSETKMHADEEALQAAEEVTVTEAVSAK
jgi:hypothetical protein